MDKDCIGCYHYRAFSTANLMCHYMFDTGKKRPCDPGNGCTVYVKKRKNHNEEGEPFNNCTKEAENGNSTLHHTP